MIGMRSGLGTKYGADTADPGAVGVLKAGTVKRRRPPKNIKGLVKKRTKKKLK